MEFLNDLKNEDLDVKEKVSMKDYTSFKIGGDAQYFIEVFSKDELLKVLKYVRKHNIPFTVIGNGTNILVSDKGLKGIVIKNSISNLDFDKNEDGHFVTVGSGMSLTSFCQEVANKGIGPVDKIYGIPGSVGGAIYMNAGAFGLCMKDLVHKTEYVDKDGNIHEVYGDDHQFDYRKSLFSGKDYIITNVTFKFDEVEKQEQLDSMKEIMQRRIDKQPLTYPSAGSTFKRGDNFITSQVIDLCGLKGTTIGGAQVSEKHGGFVINIGDATCKDVIELTNYVKEQVLQKEGKKIELEVVILGEE